MDQYLQTYSWNKVKYRIDKPMAEIVDSLRKVSGSMAIVLLAPGSSRRTTQELAGIDTDVRNKFSQYNTNKNSLVGAQRKQA